MFLALLATAWIAVFSSAALRARRTAPLSTAARFQRGMELIAPAEPASRRSARVRAPRSSFARSQGRRRVVLALLVAAVPASAVVVAVEGGAMWEVHLGIDALLALYAVFLLEAKRRRFERAAKVRSIARRGRSGSSRSSRRRGRERAVRFYEPARADLRR